MSTKSKAGFDDTVLFYSLGLLHDVLSTSRTAEDVPESELLVL